MAIYKVKIEQKKRLTSLSRFLPLSFQTTHLAVVSAVVLRVLQAESVSAEVESAEFSVDLADNDTRRSPQIPDLLSCQHYLPKRIASI